MRVSKHEAGRAARRIARRSRVRAAAWLAAALALPLGAGGQPREEGRDETALLPPTAAKLAIWTDRLAYTTWRHTIRAYVAMERRGDEGEYHRSVHLEHVPSGRRRYWRESGYPGEEPPPAHRMTGWIPDRPPTLLRWSGRVLEPGPWRFVAELRSADRTEAVKRVAAGFVVSRLLPLEVGRPGVATEIWTDTVWGWDRVRVLRGPVFVRAGATLRLEPGTLVLAQGADAALVVERGGRLVADGRADAPVVLSCAGPVGEREPGCWGGLVLLGQAPVGGGVGTAPGVEPPSRGTYGGEREDDSSGVLRYVRVEFGGAGAHGAGIGLYGVGAGTVIDRVQAHASGGDGIRFAGGAARCRRCVSSGSRGHGVSWQGGWRGAAQSLYVQQHGAGSGCGAAGRGRTGGGPKLFNATLVGPGAAGAGCGFGLLLGPGAGATVRNLAVTGFGAGAVGRDGAASGAGSISHGVSEGQPPDGVGTAGGARWADEDPLLVNVRWEAGTDPRPWLGSAALRVGAAAVPPSDGWLDTSAEYVGAFGASNWLEPWTFFGPESDYVKPEPPPSDDGSD